MENRTGDCKKGLGPVTIVVISLAALLVLFLYCAFSVNYGLFPGTLFARAAADNYLKKFNDSSVVYKGYTFETSEYHFNYSRKTDEFEITVKGDQVTYDGYSDKFLNDKNAQILVNKYFSELLGQTEGIELFFEITDLIPTYEDNITEEKVPDYVKSNIGDHKLTVNIISPDGDFDTHKKQVYAIVKNLKDNDVIPCELNVQSYDRNLPESTADLQYPLIILYESKVQSYKFAYTEDILAAAGDTHFYVKLTDEQAAKYKAFQILRVIYTSALSVTIIVLVILRLTKYEKKRKKC